MNTAFENIMHRLPNSREPIITLLTDFGTTDGFIGVMKGVMLQIAPGARLVDISHDLPPYSIQAGVFLNQWSYGYFPQGTVHLCVVDPGVGTSRRMLAVEVSGHLFVAPDNGVLSPILRIDEQMKIVSITNSRYWLDTISHTFHGRDIFAPVAAHLAAGVGIEELGEGIVDPIRLLQPKLSITSERIVCEIEYIDRFGNLITTLPEPVFRDWVEPYGINAADIHITAEHVKIEGIAFSYGEKPAGTLLAVFDGYNRLELSVNQGNAMEQTRLHYGNEVVLSVG